MTATELAIIDAKIPRNRLWDGFWIDDFKRNRLVVAASFDRTYYRDISLIFTKTTFFNLPHQWRDTDFVSQACFLQLATKEEFSKHHPEFQVQDEAIIKIELKNSAETIETYFVVCQNLRIYHHQAGNDSFNLGYKDPLIGKSDVELKQNRVSIIKQLRNG